ncbi:ABC transporter permease [Longispora sp. NPDC051575]|uniref:ABC transporter permease n=1 Tax=Longispora sp. NPDC051575 TaxID=3154943 RepID=UPI00344843E5
MSRKKDRIDRLAVLAASRAETGESLWRVAFKRVRRSPPAVVGAVIIVVFLLIALLGPLFAPYDPVAQTWRGDISEANGIFPGPRSGNLLGVDNLGRDEFSRLLIGARISLLVGVLATLFGLVIGSALGIASGTAAGLGGRVGSWIDSVIMRFIDILLSVPGLLLAISLAAMIGNGLPTVMIAVGTINVPIFARLLRGSMLAQAHSDYVLASTALGVRKPKIVFGHIVPNSIAPVIVQATLTLAVAIIEAAGLSFLGLGNANSSYPEWGVMLADAQRYLSVAPRMSIFPAVAIIITALGFTLLGESMREALDPKLRR